MLSEERNKEIQFTKNTIMSGIEKISNDVERIKPKMVEVLKFKMADEILLSVIYLKTFHDNFMDSKIETNEDAWKFMNDVKGIPEKMYYITNYLRRIEEAIKSANG